MGHHRHGRARSSSGCAADGGDRVHGPARNRHGRDGAGRPRGRPARCKLRRAAPALPQWRSGSRFRPRWQSARASDASKSRACFSASGDAIATTLALTSTLLLIGTSFFIFDGLQVIAAGALRGFNDTRVPLLFAAVSFWLVGLRVRLSAGVLAPASARSGSGSAWCSGLSDYAALLVMRVCPLWRILDICRRREEHRCTRRIHDGTPDRHAPRPSRRRCGRRRGGTDLRALHIAGRDRRGRRLGPAIRIAGRLLRVESASPERIAPICPHFGVCGGCALQHWNWNELSAPGSATLVRTALQQAGLDTPVDDLIDAHGEGRRRAVFHARSGTHGMLAVGFAAAHAHHIVPIDRCPILAPALDGALAAAWAIAQELEPTRQAARHRGDGDRWRASTSTCAGRDR